MQAAFFRWIEQVVELATSNRSSQQAAVATPGLEMLQQVEQARQEWLNTDRYFDSVTDPELVDHAILLKEAAQKKYMYLLKQARAEGLRAFPPEPMSDVEAADLATEGAAVSNVSCE